MDMIELFLLKEQTEIQLFFFQFGKSTKREKTN